jgi:16S rRNA (adenine1518-N6/adenine1519-N6)-dimethyltransferase
MHVARKRFGQHFLVDEALIGRIVDEVDPRPGDALIEIGPGLGALTRPLRERLGNLTVIEIDRDLAARWRREPGVTVIEADVLTVDFAALAAQAGRGLRIVGNLPYNISTPILFRLLAAAAHVVDQHVMLQKEVVDRMVGGPGTRDYGRLSVMLQWRYAMDAWLEVPPQAFDPPPRVDSAVIRMVPRPFSDAVYAAAVAAVLEPLVQAAFSQRRKLLRHALGPWIERAVAQRGVSTLPPFDLQRRAEEVPVDQYVALATALASSRAAA